MSFYKDLIDNIATLLTGVADNIDSENPFKPYEDNNRSSIQIRLGEEEVIEVITINSEYKIRQRIRLNCYPEIDDSQSQNLIFSDFKSAVLDALSDNDFQTDIGTFVLQFNYDSASEPLFNDGVITFTMNFDIIYINNFATYS